MCRRVTCPACGRPTWAGCGAHIEQALAGVPEAERCHCQESTTEQRTAAPPPATKSWLGRLLGG